MKHHTDGSPEEILMREDLLDVISIRERRLSWWRRLIRWLKAPIN